MWRVVITIQYGKNRHTVYYFFRVYEFRKVCYIRMAIFTTLRGEIHNSTIYSTNYKVVWKSIVW